MNPEWQLVCQTHTLLKLWPAAPARSATHQQRNDLPDNCQSQNTRLIAVQE